MAANVLLLPTHHYAPLVVRSFPLRDRAGRRFLIHVSSTYLLNAVHTILMAAVPKSTSIT